MSEPRRQGQKSAPKERKTRTPVPLGIIPIPIADEINPGDSLTDKLLQALRQNRLAFASGDILVVKHKIVSKAEGRIVDLATITPSADSISWAKKYNLDARVIDALSAAAMVNSVASEDFGPDAPILAAWV